MKMSLTNIQIHTHFVENKLQKQIVQDLYELTVLCFKRQKEKKNNKPNIPKLVENDTI